MNIRVATIQHGTPAEQAGSSPNDPDDIAKWIVAGKPQRWHTARREMVVIYKYSYPYGPWRGEHWFDNDADLAGNPSDYCYTHQAFCLDSDGPLDAVVHL